MPGIKILPCAVMIAVVINLVLPFIARPFASAEEIKPPNGAGNLSFKSQLMHMLVHHAQVPISSSVIIAAIVASSLVLCKPICKNQRL